MIKHKLRWTFLIAVIVLGTIGLQSRSQASQSPVPLAAQLIQVSDLPKNASWFAEAQPDLATDTGQFTGLLTQEAPPQESEAIQFIGGRINEAPQTIVQVLYRYETAAQALAQWERTRQSSSESRLGRSTPILQQREQAWAGGRGFVLEAADPIGTAYWFIGVRGNTVTILCTLGPGEAGQRELLQAALPQVGRLQGNAP